MLVADSPWLPAMLWIALVNIVGFVEAWFREGEA